ncbi:predicted protein [Sclerotinia sclerotiorum 1980 UF-70]|uniref:Uncharacterized protein n=1 Tax=Sclerotinia sclerotiorum (strain ATCC 18683 / 1980 / Ss-1) TaxID=665079 RepID=A7EPB0_SCLS1|nr:predicted protein [Sclerotinia sclerotiorum 1980 UF-70]EDO04676.1 predicted protein [Sclerotinia sclerotiorum 1980 UF-70]
MSGIWIIKCGKEEEYNFVWTRKLWLHCDNPVYVGWYDIDIWRPHSV